MKTIIVEDEYSIIEIVRIKPTWLQIKQIWKDDGDEDNIIIVNQGQIDELIVALRSKWDK